MTQTLVERTEALRKLWGMFFPDLEVPGIQFLSVWAATYTDKEIEYAAARTARKFMMGATNRNTVAVGQYISSVMRNQRIRKAQGVTQ